MTVVLLNGIWCHATYGFCEAPGHGLVSAAHARPGGVTVIGRGFAPSDMMIGQWRKDFAVSAISRVHQPVAGYIAAKDIARRYGQR
ncbi:hypothetical protein [Sphingobium baderi]|uniref:hypothetical protein n=1 Tax=Sphingobium baderi TaxID=1332080 RepID=UPI002B4045AD|nr:hypothetical protein [Sphingobium baderi]WRD78893.1 hypothetical protein QQ987_19715 [Sphingobium baderi]